MFAPLRRFVLNPGRRIAGEPGVQGRGLRGGGWWAVPVYSPTASLNDTRTQGIRRCAMNGDTASQGKRARPRDGDGAGDGAEEDPAEGGRVHPSCSLKASRPTDDRYTMALLRGAEEGLDLVTIRLFPETKPLASPG